MTEQEIHNICNKYDIRNYTINPDGSIEVDGDVNLSNRNLTKLKLNFNKVSGSFYCHYNKLTTLEGCPKEVSGDFFCSFNHITSLEGYNGEYDKLYCNNKDGLILKLKRKQKLKLINEL